MSRIALLPLAQRAIAAALYDGAIAIDATVGNGHDTLFLAQQVGERGQVFGFDIQPVALEQARTRLAQAGLLSRVSLINRPHEQMFAAIPGQYHGAVRAVMFNLGYLPGGDKTIVTRTAGTLRALQSALALLATGGARISVIAYTGHAQGREEAQAVRGWVEALRRDHYRVDITVPPAKQAPELILIEKSATPQ
ncbi:MAG: 16S rRNA (cytosine(1402)-N(4))-methyltransferase [Gammaproteobacteria bacterium RBG_16_57_12]|nr:MAG: 16S rRNA (cytosine(1402)-N(4))-methyltransferase [Gammaproteobacteria bacterium RBG_16_57_12]